LDVDPKPLGALADGAMGTLTITGSVDAQAYGELAIRYNGLRDFYACVREQLTFHAAAELCK
jgi:hypothetical protein